MWMTLCWTGKIFFQPSCFPTIQATTPPLQQCSSNFYSARNLNFCHFQTGKFRGFIKANQLQQSIFNYCKKLCLATENIACKNSEKVKQNFDKNAFPHSFKIDDLVWYKDFALLGKKAKLTPKWQGPAKITEIKDTNAHILLPNSKSKVLNVMCLNAFFGMPTELKQDSQEQPDLDFNSEPKITGPMIQAMKKLLDHKNTAQLAISVLCDL